METNLPEEKINMSTLSTRMNALKEQGFLQEYTIKGNKLCAGEGAKSYLPGEVKIVNFYRFEGDSDPADSSILYAIETADGEKGLLTHPYGVYADEQTTKFVTEVEEISKKTEKEKTL